MAQITVNFTFDSDAQGLTDAGLSGSVSFSYVGTDGSPTDGCVKFVGTGTEKARTPTGRDWTQFGVPAGATITAIQVTGWRTKQSSASGPLQTLSAAIVSLGNNVASAGNLFDYSSSGPTAWTTHSAGASRSVDSSYQAASTAVQLELAFTGNASPSVYLDSVDLLMTYTPSGGGGTEYDETVTVKTGQKAGSPGDLLAAIDSPIVRTGTRLALTGGAIFSDSPLVKTGLKAGDSDILLGAAITVATGQRAAVADTAVYVDTVSAFTGTRLAEIDVYPAQAVAYTGLRAAVVDGQVMVETVQARTGLGASLTDSPFAVGKVYREVVSVKTGCRAFSLADAMVAVDSPTAKTGLRLRTMMLDALVAVDSPAAMTGQAARLMSGQVYTDTPQARTGLKAAGKSTMLAFEKPTATRTGLHAGLTAQGLAFLDTPQAHTGQKAQAADLLTVVVTAQAKTGLKAAAGVVGVNVDTVQARTGQRAGNLNKAIHADTPQARTGLHTAAGITRVATDVVTTRTGQKAVADVQASFVDTVQARTGLKAVGLVTSVFTVDDLIRTLRAMAAATLPELLEIIEAKLAFVVPDVLALPYLTLVALQPRPDETAVFSNAQIVPIDFVYAVQDLGGRDNVAYARQRLEHLADALAADWQLASISGVAVVNDSNIIGTPYQRETQYQDAFSEVAEPVTCMALTGEFRLVHDYPGG